MSVITSEIFVILSLILLNGFFALAEIAVVSSRKSRLYKMADNGDHRARVALQLAESPADFLSTVQVGITLVGILSGTFAGATIAEQLANHMSNLPVIGPYSETLAIALVVLVITYIALIIGELAPKRIALNNPELIGSLIAAPMRRLSRIALPGVRFLSLSTDAVLWALRVKPSAEPSVTEEEVRILIRQGTLSGIFEKAEQEMIDRVFRLASLRVRAIMTPRKDLVVLYVTDTVEEVAHKLKAGSHSSYPLCDGSLDNVLGLVSTKDLLLDSLSGRPFELRSCTKDVSSVPESTSALKALELIKKSDGRAALVVDEFGGTQGFVTVSDFAGAIIGLLPQIEIPRIITRPDGSMLVDGLLPVDDLRHVVRVPELSSPDSHSYTTVAGLVLARIGKIPSAGDSVDIAAYRFEILDMDGLRIDKVLIQPISRPQP